MTQPSLPTGSGVTPHLTITRHSAADAIEFYIRAFGAEELLRVPTEDGSKLMHAMLRINGGMVMLHDSFPGMGPGQPSPAGATLHLEVADPDAAWARARAAGAVETLRMDTQFWGERYGRLRDPFGFEWSIGGPVGDATKPMR